MRKYLAAAALVSLAAIAIALGVDRIPLARAATPAPATTFANFTTIYVASGVVDDGGANNLGVATSAHCTNVSGRAAELRFLYLTDEGAVAGNPLAFAVVHGQSFMVSTHGVSSFEDVSAGTGALQGVLNIEATQSGIFCSAMIVDAAAVKPAGIPLHLVRVNPHPGTVE